MNLLLPMYTSCESILEPLIRSSRWCIDIKICHWNIFSNHKLTGDAECLIFPLLSVYLFWNIYLFKNLIVLYYFGHIVNLWAHDCRHKFLNGVKTNHFDLDITYGFSLIASFIHWCLTPIRAEFHLYRGEKTINFLNM
jgi:hypothetical protein